MSDPAPFDQIVFSGGGTRCFWQGGFLDISRDALGLTPARVASVSGGALTAAGFIARRGRAIKDIMVARFEEQDSNATWDDLSNGEGLTPHQRIYRAVVEEGLNAAAVDAVANGPEYHVLLGHPPRDLRSRIVATAATLAYEAELHLVGSPHFSWAEALGLDATLVDARQAARNGQLVDLVCAAAAIPPLFDLPGWAGRPVVDGGMADQAPLPPGNTGRTLILLTRDYDAVPDMPGRLYVSPTQETPADKIDFTDPEKITATWDCGERDGRAFLKQCKLT